jgi:hypothetical protein
MDPIGVLFEHPMWFEPLFAELDRRGVPFERVHAERLRYDPESDTAPYGLVFNRVSPSSWMRGNGAAIFHTVGFLGYLDDIGVTVVNGHRAFGYEISKARQLSLFSRLGIRHPRGRVVNHPGEVVATSEGLRFPVLVKPNVGGSGSGIVSFDTAEELEEAAANGGLEFGPDHTALVQEHLPAEEEAIVRIEFLGGEFLYAIRLLLAPGTFNLCPADYCDLPGVADGVSGRGLPIESYQPPSGVIEDARRILNATGAELGGVEYLINSRDGLPYYYDVNVLSNFVADAPNVVGFDPFVNLVDFLLQRAGRTVTARVG